MEIHNLKEGKKNRNKEGVMIISPAFVCDLCEGMLDVITVALRRRGSSISPVSQRQRGRHGVWFVKCGTTPVVLSGQHGGHLAAVSRSPSSFWSSELCSIEALPAHSHANTGKGSSRCETFGSLLVHL